MSRDSRLLRDPRDAHDQHAVSLKVLRLSRPFFAQQHPLPRESTKIPQHLSLALPYPSPDQSDFALSPLLILPQAFGSVYVGETFTCSLSANNELSSDSTSRGVSGIRIVAEIQTPSQSIPLDLSASLAGSDDTEPKTTPPGGSLQKIVRFDLKEEGNHVLAVNVSYTETTSDESGRQTGARTRSFRKLYQFVAQPCLGVRTKATELAPVEVDHTRGRDPPQLLRYVLEAQLENQSDGLIVLESARLQARPPFKATSLNWDMHVDLEGDDVRTKAPTLNPRDVQQVAFLVEQQQDITEGVEELQTSLNRDGRAVLGQLSIGWRGTMGEPGSLSTGNLMTRRRV